METSTNKTNKEIQCLIYMFDHLCWIFEECRNKIKLIILPLKFKLLNYLLPGYTLKQWGKTSELKY